MIFDYYNIICPKCNHRLIYNFKKDEYSCRSKCICNLLSYSHVYDINLLHLRFNNEPIIGYDNSDQNYEIIDLIYDCFFFDEKNKLISFKDTIYSFDEAFGCVSNMFNLALKVKIKLENNLLFA